MKIKRLNLRIIGIFLPCILFCVVAISAQTAESGIGKFDINKVRQAAVNQTETLSNGNLGKTDAKENESYTIIILRIIGYLALTIIVILVIAWVVKKAGIVGASRIGGGGSMDIIEVLPFGQNRNAMLVRVMDTVYLIGQTPNNIVLLEKIEGQKAIDLIASSKGGTSIMQFKDAFSHFIGKIKKPL